MIWKDFLKNTVLKPGLERLGTVAATMLLAGGDWLCANFEACGLVTQGGAHTVVTYVTAVALLAFDVAVIHVNRRKGKG
nr:MAG: hypothetical protein [Microvirus sp.]